MASLRSVGPPQNGLRLTGKNADTALMAELVVQRPWDATGLFRRLKIELDGATVARLRNNQSHVQEVRPGTHTVRAKLDWLSSPVLSIELQAHERLIVIVSPGVRSIGASLFRPSQALHIGVGTSG